MFGGGGVCDGGADCEPGLVGLILMLVSSGMPRITSEAATLGTDSGDFCTDFLLASSSSAENIRARGLDLLQLGDVAGLRGDAALELGLDLGRGRAGAAARSSHGYHFPQEGLKARHCVMFRCRETASTVEEGGGRLKRMSCDFLDRRQEGLQVEFCETLGLESLLTTSPRVELQCFVLTRESALRCDAIAPGLAYQVLCLWGIKAATTNEALGRSQQELAQVSMSFVLSVYLLSAPPFTLSCRRLLPR